MIIGVSHGYEAFLWVIEMSYTGSDVRARVRRPQRAGGVREKLAACKTLARTAKHFRALCV